MTRAVTGVEIRAYRDDDEPEVIALLDAALGGGPGGTRTAASFRWKHLRNPFGRSVLLVAVADDRIVGLRAFMRWTFVAGEGRLRAVRAVDTATHPAYQGRGVFSSLTRRALGTLPSEADLIFNTPNERSLPGYLKMGWGVVGSVPVQIKVRHPIRFLRHARGWRHDVASGSRPASSATPAALALADPRVERLLDAAERAPGIATPRTPAYLRWRYAEAPQLDYRAVGVERAGELRALAIFRVRSRGALTEATVAELILPRGAVREGRRALAAVSRASSADHLAVAFAPGSTARAAARRAAFVTAPRGMTLVVNPLGHELRPDPTSLAAWSLSLGDLEVF
jgi:GNAT superfamily N-acetyltransferase